MGVGEEAVAATFAFAQRRQRLWVCAESSNIFIIIIVPEYEDGLRFVSVVCADVCVRCLCERDGLLCPWPLDGKYRERTTLDPLASRSEI